MVKLQEAENQIVVAYEVYDRRPSDRTCCLPRSKRIKQRWAARRTWWRRMPASTGPRTRRPRKPRASSASASPTAPRRALSANASKRSVGSATARNGGRLRGSHQRGQTTAWTSSQPVQGGCRNQALGRPRGDCRQPGQHQPRHGQSAQRVIPIPIPTHFTPCRRRPAGGSARLALSHGRPKTAFCAGK